MNELVFKPKIYNILFFLRWKCFDFSYMYKNRGNKSIRWKYELSRERCNSCYHWLWHRNLLKSLARPWVFFMVLPSSLKVIKSKYSITITTTTTTKNCTFIRRATVSTNMCIDVVRINFPACSSCSSAYSLCDSGVIFYEWQCTCCIWFCLCVVIVLRVYVRLCLCLCLCIDWVNEWVILCGFLVWSR